MVSELIDMTTVSWKEQLIRAIFIPFDVDAITTILICTRVVHDFWAWAVERNGKLSVKSAYRMVLNTKENRGNWLEENAGGSRLSSNNSD